MTDLSKMSNAELLAIYQREKEGATIASLPKTDQTALGTARQEAEKAAAASRAAEEFLTLNRVTGTGGLRNIGWSGGGLSVGDLTAGVFGPNWDAMKAITAAAAPQQRVPGSGPTSDFDARMLIAGFPSTTKRGDTNTMIAARVGREEARAKARASFLDTWAKKTGTLNGGDSAFASWWAQYAPDKGLSGAPRKARAAAAPDPLGIRGR
jgi:hypothetical protein